METKNPEHVFEKLTGKKYKFPKRKDKENEPDFRLTQAFEILGFSKLFPKL